MSSSTSFQINGRSLNISKPQTIIEAADQLGIYIPRFCYHKKLSVAANCRMCLVEVEGMPKPVPACATPIMPNMQISTRSPKAKSAQRAVMEFLLINHPLDCPICDQGGQCELQDLAMRYGRDDSEFSEAKRAVSDPHLGSLIATEMTRCIQCTRCVRFGAEISGQMELGAVNRGEHTAITNYNDEPLRSELSGNMIDVCPVGALTSKPFRFKARAWELKSHASIAAHDCLGSHVYLHVHDQQVMRVVPRENELINEVWLSDRDRYAYLGLSHVGRLTTPMIKKDGHWESISWEEAIHDATEQLKTILSQHGPSEVGGLIAPNATLEEMYLFQLLCRQLGINSIDYRLRQVDTTDQLMMPKLPYAELSISEIESSDLIILIGSNLQREQPLLVPRLRRVAARNDSIVSLNCVDYPFSFAVTQKIILRPDQWVNQIKSLVSRYQKKETTLKHNVADETEIAIVNLLRQAKKPTILVGAVASNHSQAAALRYWIEQLKILCHAKVVYLTDGPNATGAAIAGVLPHREAGGKPIDMSQHGMSAHQMIQKQLKAYLLFNLDPNLDCANPYQTQRVINAADYVIAFSAFRSQSLLETADLLLPIHCFGENNGTFVNVEGKWQHFTSSVKGLGDAREGWMALQSLANQLNINIHYTDIESIQQDIKQTIKENQEINLNTTLKELDVIPMPFKEDNKTLWRITEWPLYSVDALVRHSSHLQQAGSCEQTGAYISTSCAERLGVQQGQRVTCRQPGGGHATLDIIINDTILDDCVWIPAGRSETAALGASFDSIEIIS